MKRPALTLFQQAAERRAMRDLMRLDDRLLTDIGLSRAELAFIISGRNKG